MEKSVSSVAETVLKHETVHELTGDRDLVDTEISAMKEYLANLNDMCVVNVIQCEGEQLRHVTVDRRARGDSIHSV